MSGPDADDRAGEVARRWVRIRELDRHPVPGVEHELTIVEHLKFISAAYSEEHHGRRQHR